MTCGNERIQGGFPDPFPVSFPTNKHFNYSRNKILTPKKMKREIEAKRPSTHNSAIFW